MAAHLLPAAIAACAAAAAAAAPRPNIIWWITDDQDALLGSYGVMPNLQRHLIQGGATFNNAYVASPKCCPSRTSALSGRFSHDLDDQALGWCGNFSKLENTSFVAQVSAAGYNTGFVGKYYNQEGNFCNDNVHVPAGWSYWFSMCTEVKYYGLPYNFNGRMLQSGFEPEDYLTAVLGNRTQDFLVNATAGAGAGERPFYAYISHHAPHMPAIPAPWYVNASLPSSRAPRTPNWNTGLEGKHWQVSGNGPMDAYFQDSSDALYQDRLRSLMSVDDALGAMFDLLTASGTLDNTYVIYTSDHGYHLGQYGLWAEKSQPYETDTRIPYFIRGPGITPGVTIDGLVSPMDIGATVLELAGVTQPGQRTTDGRSLVPLLTPAASAVSAGEGEAAAGSGSATADPPVPATTIPSSSPFSPAPSASAWPRDRLLIEFFGYPRQYLGPCNSTGPGPYNNTMPGGVCPGGTTPAGEVLPLIDDVTNTWAAIRIINASHNLLYAEYRPGGATPGPAATNWTEAYDLSSDPWELSNVADPSNPARLPETVLQQLSTELWAVANCRLDSCP